MTLPPYTQFFGGLVDASIRLEVLKEYIRHMDDSLDQAEAACTHTSQESIPDTLRCIADDKSDLLAEPFPKLLHAGFIVSVMIFLEQQLVFFCECLQKVEHLGLTTKDLSGSLIERFRKYCEHVARLPFPVSNSLWEDTRGVIELRNCLVHNNGLLDGFGKANTITAFLNRHGTPRIEDGRIEVDTQTSLQVLEIVQKFVEAIHQAALSKYPDEKKKSQQ